MKKNFFEKILPFSLTFIMIIFSTILLSDISSSDKAVTKLKLQSAISQLKADMLKNETTTLGMCHYCNTQNLHFIQNEKGKIALKCNTCNIFTDFYDTGSEALLIYNHN